jgi:hypothetical protein
MADEESRDNAGSGSKSEFGFGSKELKGMIGEMSKCCPNFKGMPRCLDKMRTMMVNCCGDVKGKDNVPDTGQKDSGS